jgi:hypothetical protein
MVLLQPNSARDDKKAAATMEILVIWSSFFHVLSGSGAPDGLHRDARSRACGNGFGKPQRVVDGVVDGVLYD